MKYFKEFVLALLFWVSSYFFAALSVSLFSMQDPFVLFTADRIGSYIVLLFLVLLFLLTVGFLTVLIDSSTITGAIYLIGLLLMLLQLGGNPYTIAAVIFFFFALMWYMTHVHKGMSNQVHFSLDPIKLSQNALTYALAIVVSVLVFVSFQGFVARQGLAIPDVIRENLWMQAVGSLETNESFAQVGEVQRRILLQEARGQFDEASLQVQQISKPYSTPIAIAIALTLFGGLIWVFKLIGIVSLVFLQAAIYFAVKSGFAHRVDEQVTAQRLVLMKK